MGTFALSVELVKFWCKVKTKLEKMGKAETCGVK
jgi:hypothetical protein